MMRIVVENILLFLLPTLVYATYVFLKQRTDSGAASPQGILDDAPIIWLFVAGAVLVVATLIIFGSTSGGLPGQSYEPPSFKNGQIEPGRIK